jgi:hypothetical protein
MPAAGSSSAISLRVGGQRAGDLQAALVAVAQRAGLVVGKLADAHVVQQFLRALGDGGLFGLEARRAEHGAQQARAGADVAPTMTFSSAVISANRRMFWKVRAMPALATSCTAWACRACRQLEGAAVGRVQAGDHVEEGGLAGAVGADQAVDLAARMVMPTSLTGPAGRRSAWRRPATLSTVSVMSLSFLFAFCSDLPWSGDGHRPRGRSSITMIMASAISSWRRMAGRPAGRRSWPAAGPAT